MVKKELFLMIISSEELSMKSVYDELAGKLAQDPSLTRRSGPRQDIGILLFSERDAINALWKAAEAVVADALVADVNIAGLRTAVEKLRPLFGER
jgi:hypothetical protein